MNALIYGKDPTARIVCLEPQDDITEVFIEHLDGFVTSEVIPNEYWILSDKPLDQWFKPLKGNLHYKWIKTYKSRRKFKSDRFKFQGNDIFSIYNPKESLMTQRGLTYFKGMKHNEVSCLAFDIETLSLEKNQDAGVLIISNTYSNKGKIERKIFTYDDYDNEGEMLKAWCDWVREKDPTILLGHNILMYDLPYLAYIADKWGVKLILGRNDTPIEFADYDSEFRKDANTSYNYKKVHVYGREVIDTLFLAYKYDVNRKYENYNLKNIIKEEGLEIKDRQFYDAGQIRHKYKDPEEWAKIKAYAEFDADDALSLYNLMSPAFFYITQSVARSYQHVTESASGGQINSIMNRAYLQDGHSIPKVSPAVPFEGAISFGIPGIYSNVIRWDVQSLYPSLILQYNIHDKSKDPNNYFVQIVKTFTEMRLQYKKLGKTDKYYDDLQASFKILINSCFGFLGSKFSNFNYPEGAAEITKRGRELLIETIEWLNGTDYETWKKTNNL